LLALAVFLLAAFMVFGDALITYANLSPNNYLSTAAQAIKNVALEVTAWLGLP
jgi:hypothetical protein